MNQSDKKIVKSPNSNVSKNELLIIAEAETLLKEEITNGVMNNVSKTEIYNKCSSIIATHIKLIPEARKASCRRALLQMVIRDYTLFSMNAKIIMRNAQAAIPGYVFTSPNELFEKKESIITRGFKTDRKHGLPIVANYQKQLRDEVKVLSATQAEVTEVTNGKPSKMTLRNKSEMTIRYEANLEDVKKLNDEGVDLVWTSSHVDCSARCEPYQGKLWSISGKNAGKTIDGHKVGKLNDALQGPKKDGNGIINGYNCRHYLIPYKKGSKPPVEYDKSLIKKEREVNTKQRTYESRIRQLKIQERLARKQGDKDVANKLNEKWKLLDRKYKHFSLTNGRAFYPWRTQVMRNEELKSNKWGAEIAENIKVQEENRKIVTEYEAKYIKTNQDGTISSNFEKIEDAEKYIECKGLYFKSEENEEKALEKINKKIQGALNLEKNYKPTKVSSDLIPDEIKDQLISDVAYLSLSNRKSKKEGTACHVANKHLEGCETDFLKDTMDTISNPKNYIKENKSIDDNNYRVVFYKKLDKTHKKIIILDFLKEKEGYKIEFMHNYRCKMNKKEQEMFDKIEKNSI